MSEARSLDARAEGGARCPVCGGIANATLVASDRNRAASDERFRYGRCGSCGTAFMIDPPADLSRYYVGNYHAFGPDGEPAWKGDRDLLAAEAFRVRLLLRHTRPGRLIEIGAGAGGFATAAKAAGFDVTAIEMDAGCCEYLSRGAGVEAICSDRPLEALEPLPAARVVALWHVLEHLPDPGAVLAAAAGKLEPGGLLAIAVPNPRSLQARLLGDRWVHLDAPRHLTLIPPGTLIERGRALGLECVELTTNDPSGRACNLLGWVYALRRRPGGGPAPWLAVRGGQAITALVSPVERRGDRGAAVTLVFRKRG
jgi:SAM-dependent methyltransferase